MKFTWNISLFRWLLTLFSALSPRYCVHLFRVNDIVDSEKWRERSSRERERKRESHYVRWRPDKRVYNCVTQRTNIVTSLINYAAAGRNIFLIKLPARKSLRSVYPTREHCDASHKCWIFQTSSVFVHSKL